MNTIPSRGTAVRIAPFALLPLLLLPLLSLLLPGRSDAAAQFGVRGGFSHASRDVFPGSGDLGSGGMYGFVASIGLLPVIDLEFAYERYTNDFSFDRAEFEETFFGGEGSYEDQSYLLTGKLQLPILTPPLGMYVGGGFSLHEIDLHVTAEDDDFAEYVDRLGGDRSEWEWHLVAGTSFKLPVVPFAAYGEYRFQNLTGNDNPRYHAIYGGVNLVLN